MRGDLDETLARMARREEALRRAADPGSRNAGPRPEAGTGGAGGANRSGLAGGGAGHRPAPAGVDGTDRDGPSGPSGADATGPADHPDDAPPDRRDPAGTGAADRPRPADAAPQPPAPAEGAPRPRADPDRPGTGGGGLPRRIRETGPETVRGTATATDRRPGASAGVATGITRAAGPAGTDPVRAVAEAVRRVVAEHPGVAVTLRVEHDGQAYPLRVGWSAGTVTVRAEAEVVPPPVWPMSVRTVPEWPTGPDGTNVDPAARLAEMIRRDPSLLHGDPTP
ncbi:hypothetical protein [Micromonospora rosaria]|uniref:hypothetical protein n=1 Tax=Micromonospora rosaria TaxID=47874 RepID=UPI0037C91A41